MIFKCIKCGSTDYKIIEKSNGRGIATGLYCAKCGSWHKWLGKEEKRQYEANNGSERDELLQKIEQWEKENAKLKRITTNDQLDARCYGLETIILGLQQENAELTRKIWKLEAINVEEICPICDYEIKNCQCVYAGSAHPDRSKRKQVVQEHLYLLTPVQLKHLMVLQKFWKISYSDEEKNAIYEELKKKAEQRLAELQKEE